MNSDGTVNHQPDLPSPQPEPEIIDVQVVVEIPSVPEQLGDVWDSSEIAKPPITTTQPSELPNYLNSVQIPNYQSMITGVFY